MTIRKRSALISVAAAVSGLLLLAPMAASAATPQWVVDSGIANGVRATPGNVSWYGEENNGGTYETSTAAFDGSQSLEFDTPASSDSVRALNSYGTPSTTLTIPQIRAGGSYTYSGSHVNFQIEMFYTPVDPTYGPSGVGVNKCTAAGAAFPGECYTVLKWEPLTDTPSAWKTVDLSADTALNAGTNTGGWANTNRVGIYAKPGPQVGQTMTEYLAQISSYQIIGVGVAMGSGTPGAVGFVQTMSYAGQTYNFREEPAPDPTPTPTAPTTPASSSTPAASPHLPVVSG